MKRHVVLLLLALCLMLGGCSVHPTDVMDPPVQSDETLPAPADEAARTARQSAVLWFRYLDEPALAPETRIIENDPTQSYEAALLTALIGGPDTASGALRGLFPAGTRIISTHQSGRMLFVTLSREILNDYADEPDLWQMDPAWVIEVPLRRQLAMQSIAATVTENCDADTVVILVEQGRAVTDSLRLRQGYYCLGGDPLALAEPLQREESLLLTPLHTGEIILQCWQERDFARLYKYVTRASRPDEAAFITEMNALPHLTQWQLQGGSIHGDAALLTWNGTLLQDGRETAVTALPMKLTMENGLWRISMQELTIRKEAAP